MKKTLIHPGDRFGKLTAVRRVENNPRGSQRWEFTCECGQSTTTMLYHVTSGATKSCGCLSSAINRDPITRAFVSTPDRPPWFRKAYQHWHKHYSDGCTFESFLALSQEPCHYCGAVRLGALKSDGSASEEERTFRYNGLDRKDSTKNHSEDNIVPCCKVCNYAKRLMPYEEFLNWIRSVHRHLCTDVIGDPAWRNGAA